MPGITTSGYSAGRFLIELEGQVVGAVTSVAGGEAVAEVVRERADPTGLMKKHVSNWHWEPITFTVGLAMGRPLADWVAAFLAPTAGPKDGAIVLLDDVGTVRSRLRWRAGTLTEVRFPGCDAAGHELGEVTVTLQPEGMTRVAGSGVAGGEHPAAGADPVRPTPWRQDRFRLSVSGMTHSPALVRTVEPFTVRRPLPPDLVGTGREPVAHPAAQDVSDLVLTLPEGAAVEFDQWLDDFLIAGHSSDSDERTVTLDHLGAAQEVLATLTFRHVGIVRVARERSRSGNAVTARARVQLYCEEASYSSSAAATEPPGTSEGVALGRRWAAARALPDEVAGLARPDDPQWSSIALPQGHSLIAVLRDAGILPSDETGPVELLRRPLVEGLVEGIGLVADGTDGAAADGRG